MKNEENATEKIDIDNSEDDVKPNSFIEDLGMFIIKHPIATIVLYSSIRGYGYIKGKERVINELIRSAVIKDN